MEVAPFFVDFHHLLLIFTIFYRFSQFMHFCRDLHFVAIYVPFPQIFLAKIAFSATSHVFCMYGRQQFMQRVSRHLKQGNAAMTDGHRPNVDCLPPELAGVE